jgi:hypothetical protein
LHRCSRVEIERDGNLSDSIGRAAHERRSVVIAAAASVVFKVFRR